MNGLLRLAFLAITFTLTILTPPDVEAAPRKLERAEKILKQVKRKLKRLDRIVGKLPDIDYVELLRSTSALDSDTDGVTDLLEPGRGTDVCDPDSDNDGLDDEEEVSGEKKEGEQGEGGEPGKEEEEGENGEGTEEGNGGSEEGGSMAFHVVDRIEDINDSTITLSDRQLLHHSDTKFYGRNDEATWMDFSSENCVAIGRREIGEGPPVADLVIRSSDCN